MPEAQLALFDISISNMDCRYIDTFEKVNFYTFTPFCVKTFTYKWNYFSIKFHFLLTLWSVKVNFYTVWCICTPHGEKYFTMRCKFSITFDLIKGKRPPPLKDLIWKALRRRTPKTMFLSVRHANTRIQTQIQTQYTNTVSMENVQSML